MTKDEIEAAIAKLRSEGCAVVVFNADELLGADPKWVEDQMRDYGNDVIDAIVHRDMEQWGTFVIDIPTDKRGEP